MGDGSDIQQFMLESAEKKFCQQLEQLLEISIAEVMDGNYSKTHENEFPLLCLGITDTQQVSAIILQDLSSHILTKQLFFIAKEG